MTVQIDGVPYSFEAKDPSEISKLWQIFQIFFYIWSTVTSFVVIFCFSDVIVVMQHNCILDAELLFVQKSHFSEINYNNVSCTIDIVRSKFYNEPCNIVLFTPVFVTTFACFFTCMFVMCGRGGAGSEFPDAWRIVFPTIIFNSISFCLILHAAIIFQSGVHIFLNSIKQTWNVSKIDLNDINCLQVESKKIGERVYDGLVRVRTSIWLLVTFSGLGLFWIILRFFFAVDFQLVRITIRSHPSRPITAVHKQLIEDDRQDVIRDSEDSGSLSDESYYSALSELTQPEQTVPPQPQVRIRRVQFNDNPQELPNNITFTQLRDASTSTRSSFRALLNMPKKKK